MGFSDQKLEEFGSIKEAIKNFGTTIEEIKTLLQNLDKKVDEKFDENRDNFGVLEKKVDSHTVSIQNIEEKIKKAEEDKKSRNRFFKDGLWRLPAFILGGSALLGAIFDFLYRIPPR